MFHNVGTLYVLTLHCGCYWNYNLQGVDVISPCLFESISRYFLNGGCYYPSQYTNLPFALAKSEAI